MQNSQSFKSYVLDPSQVAGFKATLKDVGIESATTGSNTDFHYSSKTSQSLNGNEQVKVLESKL